MPPINVLMKPSSGMCNMKCSYCFYVDEMQNREIPSRGFMTEKTLENVISKTLEFADAECTFAYQGGEPTLAGIAFYEKAVELQKKYNKKNLKIQNALQTNGYTIDEHWCSFFAENKFLIGLSIDGIRQSHDSNRRNLKGEETFFTCLKAAALMDQYHVDYNILTVVNRQTASKIHKIYREYEKRGFRYQQYIACLDPLSEEPGHMPYSLTPEIYGTFLCDLFRMWSDDLFQNRQPYIRQFENYIGILAGIPPDACEQNGICAIQNVVEADGTVYPCDFYMLDEYRLGNLNEVSFQEINQTRIDIGFIEKSANHSPACKRCDYFHLCRGGCRRQRIDELDQAGNRNFFCESYKLLFDKHYKTMRKIADRMRMGGY